ncbi:hypothetical protein [Pararhodonellum marinum]|uniref:hypothetical protein n=1 Tax=Pararhodonellum marinum TaxID=2755358 RepID=UPI0018905FCB|nr:hypothetical protein [Pararhodonellum marinum]
MIKKFPLLIFYLTILILTSMGQSQNEFAVGDCLSFKANSGDYYGFVVTETSKKKNGAKIGLTPVIIKSKNMPTDADFRNGKVFINDVLNGSTNKNEEGFFVLHLFEPGFTTIAGRLTRVDNIALDNSKYITGGGTSASSLEQFEQMLNMIPAFIKMGYKEAELKRYLK